MNDTNDILDPDFDDDFDCDELTPLVCEACDGDGLSWDGPGQCRECGGNGYL